MMPTCLLQLLCHMPSWLLQFQQNVSACMPALIAAANAGPALMMPTCLLLSSWLLQLHLCLGSKPLRLVRLALRLLQLLLVLQLVVVVAVGQLLVLVVVLSVEQLLLKVVLVLVLLLLELLLVLLLLVLLLMLVLLVLLLL